MLRRMTQDVEMVQQYYSVMLFLPFLGAFWRHNLYTHCPYLCTPISHAHDLTIIQLLSYMYHATKVLYTLNNLPFSVV